MLEAGAGKIEDEDDAPPVLLSPQAGEVLNSALLTASARSSSYSSSAATALSADIGAGALGAYAEGWWPKLVESSGGYWW